MKRKNKDKTMNNRGREFVELVGNIGGYIPNGTITGDEEGEFMYVGPKCSSVIDYMVVNENCKKIVKNFRIVERVDSNHMPLLLEIEEDGGRREATRKKEGDNKAGEEKSRIRIWWNIKAKQEFRRRTNAMSEEINWEGKSAKAIWKELKKIIQESLVKEERKGRKRTGYKAWWDRSCMRGKRELNRVYKRWRRGRSDRKTYLAEKKKWKKFLKER